VEGVKAQTAENSVTSGHRFRLHNRARAELKVKAVLDTNDYETGVEISKEDIHQLRLKRHKVHPEWNHTLLPRKPH
jgi:hypothetical protein